MVLGSWLPAVGSVVNLFRGNIIMPVTIGEHISALIATIALVIVLGIVGELELRDIEHLEQQQKEQRR